MTVSRADLADRLRAGGVPDPEVSARWLLDDAPAADVLEQRVIRRLAREPLQLILGGWPFREVDLELQPGVFVPRPETEVVAGVAIDAAHAAAARGPVRVVEPCCGSGAIVTALLHEVPTATAIATDLSPLAVDLTRRNLARAGVADRVAVHVGDLLASVHPDWRGTVDVLVSNPPYLPAADAETWAAEVADHDPVAALVGGDDGHEVVDRLLDLARTWLRPGGVVVVEIDDRRGADARAAAVRAGLDEVRTVADLTGRDRAVVARRPVPGSGT